jgi:hypothetical protein
MTLTTTMDTKKMELTASEAANLWNQYSGDTSAICINTFLHKTCEDKDIQSILENALQLSNQHVKKITQFLNQADYPIPVGFTLEDDVNLDAPRLFSDSLTLYYMEIMTIHGITSYSLSVTTCEGDEIRNYYIECLAQASDLLNKIISVSKTRGQYDRTPMIPPPKNIDFVEDKGVISVLFAEPKPLSVTEIGNLFFNLRKTILAKTASMAFSQVAQQQDVRQFFIQYAERADEHVQRLSVLMQNDDLPTPHTWDADILPSTTSPFSDKLMMFHISFKLSAAIAYYGTGQATTTRVDVIAIYIKLIAEVMKIGSTALTLMNKYRWMEQQPQAVDRKTLARRK